MVIATGSMWALLTVHMIHPVSTWAHHVTTLPKTSIPWRFMFVWHLRARLPPIKVDVYSPYCVDVHRAVCTPAESYVQTNECDYTSLTQNTDWQWWLNLCTHISDLHNGKKPLITNAIHPCPHTHTVHTTDCMIHTYASNVCAQASTCT